ncbi:AraC-like DNA-binding protein [Pedobacter africanus]|uniref:AraC-like DNA-binding protein n=1 Tax=Pedobacter africanus TaxID=151894 RepID=A0ACC6KRK1_9SPHI|nr:AraC family transcriptional regulator [Pedobacter africanus]MDR6781836.1 AraC-like DNA-binding protein [Pedobacter africanus]
MNNYFKYLPVSEHDASWGLYVLNVGYNSIGPAAQYPSAGHPSDHQFSWDKGRILEEFQLIYITRGKGVFESKNCKQTRIKEGTIILLFPNEWHRFKPDENTGWDEFWVGFNGDIINNIALNRFLSPSQSFLPIGIHEHLIGLFTDIIEKTRDEQSGYQPLVAGMVLHLLGDIYTRKKQEQLKEQDISEAIINKAKALLRANVKERISIEKIAVELQVSYSWLRKAFKSSTGIAPLQYLLQLKIERARGLLSGTKKPIKTIAYELGFESSFYFSRLFKLKTNYSPEAYRKRMNC